MMYNNKFMKKIRILNMICQHGNWTPQISISPKWAEQKNKLSPIDGKKMLKTQCQFETPALLLYRLTQRCAQRRAACLK